MGKSETGTKSNNKFGGSKDKSKDASSSSKATAKGDSKSGGPEPANSINVRQILCEEQGKIETVPERLANREKLDAIAREPKKTRRAMEDRWGERSVGL